MKIRSGVAVLKIKNAKYSEHKKSIYIKYIYNKGLIYYIK